MNPPETSVCDGSPTLIRVGYERPINSMPLVMRVCRLCAVIAAVFGIGIYVLLALGLLRPSLELSSLSRLLLISFFAAMAFLAVVHGFDGSAVVLMADKTALYYSVRGNKNIYVQITWPNVAKIDYYNDDGVPKLKIETTLSKEVVLLRPRHGEVLMTGRNGRWYLLFSPGYYRKLSKYETQLNELRIAG